MTSDKIAHDSETAAQGQQVFTACAFIHHDFDGITKVFMPKRAATKKFLPNKFELPGGHVDYGEQMEAALAREVQEELEKDIVVGDPFAVFTYMNEVKGSHSIEVDYFAQFKDGIGNIVLHPEDHSEYRWLSEAELGDYLEENDDETRAIRRGFALLRGEPIRT